MVDKNKYLYWLNNDDSNLTDEVIWREMYSRIGHIFHIVQMVEYNIANILSIEEFKKETKTVFEEKDIEIIKTNIDLKFEKLSTLTFGQLSKEVEKSNYLKEIDMQELKNFVNYRNYLAHRCFKEKLLAHELADIEDIDSFIDELNDFEVRVATLNEYLIHVFKTNKIKTILLKA